ncbi:hypothetical protein BDF14DRAFT_1719393 [Spinellus fusiger]|nr:hypothetical protein BDF14DRAFT_1719393 [Spinellus fusiger]
MKNQFADNNKASIYKADDLIKLHKLKQIEVLLLETSSHFRSDDGVKSSFDYHKGLFGVLAMLKTVADEFYLGSEKVFSKLKLVFSMKFVKENPAYELWLEGALGLKTSFDKKVEQLPKALEFFG